MLPFWIKITLFLCGDIYVSSVFKLLHAMAFSLTVPTTVITDGWNKVSDACAWAGVTDAEWTALSTAMGEAGFESLLLLASLDDDDWEEARKEAKLPMIRRAAANLMYSAVKYKFQVATRINAPMAKVASDPGQTAETAEAPTAAASSKDGAASTAGGDHEQVQASSQVTSDARTAEQQQPVLTQTQAFMDGTPNMAGTGSGSAQRGTTAGVQSPGTAIVISAANGIPMGEASVGRVNLGLVVNQSLTQEVPMLSERELTPMRERYINIVGDEPLDVTEVTNAQITALHAVLSQGLPPYADFGVWVPHGGRLARKQKFTNRYVDTAGNWHSSELSGPPNLESWRTSWAVFTTASVMLSIATPATLTRYERRFVERCQRYPRAWHLAVVADDRCRSEFLLAEQRRQERFHKEHPALSAYNPAMPWESVLKEASSNLEFWMREFQEPAMNFTRDRGEITPNWIAQQPTAEDRGTKRPPNEGAGTHPRRNGYGYTTTRQGAQICRHFQTGVCDRENCTYAHTCQKCLGPHPMNKCPRDQKGDKGKGKGKGKGKSKKKTKGEQAQQQH